MNKHIHHKRVKKRKSVVYEEDPFGLGDIDESRLVVVKDFLPPPHLLAQAKLIVTKETL